MKPQITDACPYCGQALEADIDGDWVCVDCLFVYVSVPLEVALRQQIERNAAQIERNGAVLGMSDAEIEADWQERHSEFLDTQFHARGSW